MRVLQGLQNTGAGFQRFEYLGLGFDLEQSTLNWGKWQANFLGLGNQVGATTRNWATPFWASVICGSGTSSREISAWETPSWRRAPPAFLLNTSWCPSKISAAWDPESQRTNYGLGAHAGTLT